eukprot:scaffold28678_cov111-Isochrysis_galbana.AAC.6
MLVAAAPPRPAAAACRAATSSAADVGVASEAGLGGHERGGLPAAALRAWGDPSLAAAPPRILTGPAPPSVATSPPPAPPCAGVCAERAGDISTEPRDTPRPVQPPLRLRPATAEDIRTSVSSGASSSAPSRMDKRSPPPAAPSPEVPPPLSASGVALLRVVRLSPCIPASSDA